MSSVVGEAQARVSIQSSSSPSSSSSSSAAVVSTPKTCLCYSCHRNITHSLRITCCECVVSGKHVVVLCGDCFSVGVSFVVTESLPSSNSSSNINSNNNSNSNSSGGGGGGDSNNNNNSNNSSNNSSDNQDDVRNDSALGKIFDGSSQNSSQSTADSKRGKPATIMRHLGSHRYKVSDCLDFQFFPSTHSASSREKDEKSQAAHIWTAQEELLLLEGILKCGVGNWKTISEYIIQSTTIQNSASIGSKENYGSAKTPKQVEDHYWELYMGQFGYCLPSKALHKGAVVDLSDLISTGMDCQAADGLKLNEIPVFDGYSKGEMVVRDKEKAVRAQEKESKSKDKDKERERDISGGSAGPSDVTVVGYDLPGFMPLRQDFDYEFDNDAEALLSNMEFNDEDDHPSERQLKLQVVDIYNQRLVERENRRAFVIKRGLVDVKKIQNNERRMSKEDRDILARLKVFARFHSAEDHEALVDCIVKARRLRDQIALYQEYRKMGIKTLEQARTYEGERRKKDHEAKVRRNKEGGALSSSSYIFDITTSTLYDTLLANAASINTSSSSSSSLSFSSSSSMAKVQSGRKDNFVEPTSPRGSKSGAVAGSRRARDWTLDGIGLDHDGSISLKDAPGGDLLTNKEVVLCEAIGVLPKVFLAMKEAVVREWYRNGHLSEAGVSRVVKLDEGKTRKMYDFFIKEVDLSGVENALCLSTTANAARFSSSLTSASSSQPKSSNNNSQTQSQISGDDASQVEGASKKEMANGSSQGSAKKRSRI